MDNEQKTKFELELESLEQTVEYQKLKTQQPEPEEEEKDEGSKVVTAPKWRAPEGWTPPGWNEEKSYQTAMKFIGFNANPK